MKIDGRKIADEILKTLEKRVKKLKKRGIVPKLAIITIHPSLSTKSFIRQKLKTAVSLKIEVELIKIFHKAHEKEIIRLIEILNRSPKITGIIIQLPLPSFLKTKLLAESVSPEKDIDGFLSNSKFLPPIGLAILKILEKIPRLPKKKKILIVGRGVTAGNPIAKTLGKKGVDFSIAHSQTKNIKSLTKESNIIISCVGKPRILKPDMLTKGVVLIGVGDWRDKKGRLHGDFEEEEVAKIASFYTPTPGGVGPVNVACLMENLVQVAEKSKI